jgi:uncharacterized membrane protein
VSKSSRYLGFFAYLLSLPGALFVLLARRDDAFAVYHARQSLAIAVAAIVTPLLWAIIAWACAWIPLVGAVIGLALFALLIATYCGLAVSWIVGMVFALQGTARSVPFVGGWAVRRPKAIVTSEPETDIESSAELIERTSPGDA